MTLHRSPPLLALLIALFFLSVGAHAGAAEYKVMDSGRVLFPFAYSIQWLDKDRVLAVLMEEETWTSPEGKTYGLQGIYVWNTATNELKRHAGPGAGGLCVGNGFVRYFKRAIERGNYEELDRYFGPFGQEKKVEPSGPIDLNTCKLESELPSSAWVEQVVAREKEKNGQVLRMTRLREAHGWLAFHDSRTKADPVRPDHPIAIYPPGKEDKPILIDRTPFEPWLAKGYKVEFLRYETFKNAYLLAVDDYQFAGQEFTVLWWLYPDGKIEHLLTQRREGDWANRFFAGRMAPTRNSLLAAGGRTSSQLVNKEGLHWRTPDGKAVRVDHGHVGGTSGISTPMVVSPDGCKVAYGIDPRGLISTPPEAYHLHVINTCTPDGR